MADNQNGVPFARLFADAVQSTYKGLHALIDDLVDADSETRRERLVEFAIEKRHLFARLLITVRWYMNYSAFHNSAQSSLNLANSRSAAFQHDADSLWSIWSLVRSSSSPSPALHQAAEVLGASVVFDRLPRCIIDMLGLDSYAILHNVKPALPANPTASLPAKKPAKPVNVYAEPDDADEDISSEAVERLGSLTRRVITEHLPNGISVVQYSAPPEGAAVRIGVPGAWTADLILSSLVLDQARLHILQFQILVDSDPNSQSSRSQWRNDHRPVRMGLKNCNLFRDSVDERMGWIMASAVSNGKTDQRFTLALRSLANLMSNECAGALVIAHIRAGLKSMLPRKRWQQAGLSAEGKHKEEGKKTPVEIFYWPKSHAKALLRISVPPETEKSCAKIVEIEHDPPFPAGEPPLQIDFERVNAQKIVLDAARVRARHELCKLQRLCEAKFNPSITSAISDSQQSALSLIFFVAGHGACLELALSLTSGAAFIAPKGALQLALSDLTGKANPLHRMLWKGERFFKARGTTEFWDICEKILTESVSLLQHSASIRAMSAIGHGATMHWPPGVPSVEKPVKGSVERPVQAPFCALDLNRPRCLLSLGAAVGEKRAEKIPSERPPAKRRRVHFNFTESGGIYFFEGRLREDHASLIAMSEMSRSARAIATWTEVHHDMWLRLKRDKIVKMLAANKIMPELPREVSISFSERVRVDMKTLPLETEKAMLLIGNDDDWGVELTLTNDVFNHEAFRGYGMSYNAHTRVLRFYYPSVTKATVVQFGRDVMRARTAGTLSHFLKEKAGSYSVEHRTPSRMVVDMKGLRLSVGLGSTGMEVETWPKHQVFQAHLVPLMEELLMESRKKMGHSLAALLTMSVPMGLALQKALPKDRTSYRLRFLTCLWVRIAVGGRRNGKRVTHCIDVNVQGGVSRVHVSDYGMQLRQRVSKGGKDAGPASQFAEMPKWGMLVKQVVEKKVGRTVNEQGSTVEISMSLLGEVLSKVIKLV